MMKLRLVFLLSFLSLGLFAQYDMNYYLPDGLLFDPDVPAPAEIIGHGVGEYHISHDKLVQYMQVLDQTSDRVSVDIIGYTHEKRPLILVIFTSPENQNNLEKLRRDHLESIDPKRNKTRIRQEPLVINMGYSVHGNEASGVNAALVVAYYLAACQNNDVADILDNSIILLDPCLNPDGVTRFATCVNSHKSLNNVSDPASMEFGEAYPGSRSNHYWYDLNRDWLFLQHPESQATIKAFHQWMPQVLTDHHEMGGSSTFFFQPGVESRNNPVVPASNYALTQKIGTFHAAALDEINSLYVTQEMFDDFYFGKGSAYPDLNGAIGILFEQASSRGHVQETAYGKLTFPFTIRNQVRTSLSTIKASWSMRKELQYHQADYFETALKEAEASPVKGYVFGLPEDPERSHMMIEILLQHQVEVLPIRNDVTVRGMQFPSNSSYLINCAQPQYRMVKTLMEKVTSFADSTFYDISTWTLPLAMGVNYAELDTKDLAKCQTGRALLAKPGLNGALMGGIAKQAYVFSYDPYFAPTAVQDILEAGIRVKVANQSFNIGYENETLRFDAGSIMVPVQMQEQSSAEIKNLLQNLAVKYGLTVYSVSTAFTMDGPDLGSGSFSFVKNPSILVLAGGRVSSREAGQIWHLFDTRFDIPMTLGDVENFGRFDLNRYNTLILPSGSYSELGESQVSELKTWVRAGGNIIALKSANSFLRGAEMIKYSSKPAGKTPSDDEKFKPYSQRRSDYVGRSIPGSIFEAQLDLSHPLGYGYQNDKVSIFKNATGFVAPSSNPYSNPLYYGSDPLLSGYINQSNLEGLKESVVVQSYSFGRGKIISFFDDPFFRAYFAGEHKLFLNAVLFGDQF